MNSAAPWDFSSHAMNSSVPRTRVTSLPRTLVRFTISITPVCCFISSMHTRPNATRSFVDHEGRLMLCNLADFLMNRVLLRSPDCLATNLVILDHHDGLSFRIFRKRYSSSTNRPTCAASELIVREAAMPSITHRQVSMETMGSGTRVINGRTRCILPGWVEAVATHASRPLVSSWTARSSTRCPAVEQVSSLAERFLARRERYRAMPSSVISASRSVSFTGSPKVGLGVSLRIT